MTSLCHVYKDLCFQSEPVGLGMRAKYRLGKSEVLRAALTHCWFGYLKGFVDS